MRLWKNASARCPKWLMNSHNQDIQPDLWFCQALESYAHAEPSRDVWPRIVSRVHSPSPSRWQRFLLRFARLAVMDLPLSHQAVRGKDGKFSPSPLLGVMIKQVLDMRMAF